jgi:hypothetical protein
MAMSPLATASDVLTDRIHIVLSPGNSGNAYGDSDTMDIIIGLIDKEHRITVINNDTGMIVKWSPVRWSTRGSFSEYLLSAGRWTVSFDRDIDKALVVFPEDEQNYQFEPGKITEATKLNVHDYKNKFYYKIVNKTKGKTRDNCLVVSSDPSSDVVDYPLEDDKGVSFPSSKAK